jgi:hypothetical protein
MCKVLSKNALMAGFFDEMSEVLANPTGTVN